MAFAFRDPKDRQSKKLLLSSTFRDKFVEDEFAITLRRFLITK